MTDLTITSFPNRDDQLVTSTTRLGRWFIQVVAGDVAALSFTTTCPGGIARKAMAKGLTVTFAKEGGESFVASPATVEGGN